MRVSPGGAGTAGGSHRELQPRQSLPGCLGTAAQPQPPIPHVSGAGAGPILP